MKGAGQVVSVAYRLRSAAGRRARSLRQRRQNDRRELQRAHVSGGGHLKGNGAPLACAQRQIRATAAQPRSPQASTAASCSAKALSLARASTLKTGLASTFRSALGGNDAVPTLAAQADGPIRRIAHPIQMAERLARACFDDRAAADVCISTTDVLPHLP